LGEALTALAKPREAIEPLQKAVNTNPTLAISHIDLGIAYSQSGLLDDAIKEFREAIRLDPNNALAYLYLGETFGKSNRLKDKIAAELHATSLNPRLAGAHYLLGTAYAATNRPFEAATEYAKAIKLNPDYFEAYAGLAIVSIQLGRTADALSALQAVQRLNATSDNFAVYLSLASCYQTFNLWERTVSSASRAITLNSKCVECYWFLGNGYQYMGRLDESRKAYQQALAINPNYSGALYGLGLLAETSGDFNSADKYFDAASRSLGRSTNDRRLRGGIEGSILAERGNIERDLGNYAEAFGFYTKAIEAFRSITDHKLAGWTLAQVAEVYRQIGFFERRLNGTHTPLQKAGRLETMMHS
jgi:tetratricopeptide (TPR) repeat protein